jgi:hypothetical protein
MISIVRKLWGGEYSLPVAFWGFYVGGAILSLLAAAPVLIASYRLDVSVYWAIVAVRTAILIVTSAGVWRSARQNIASPIWMSRLWGYGARAVVVLWLARIVWINVATLANPSN